MAREAARQPLLSWSITASLKRPLIERRGLVAMDDIDNVVSWLAAALEGVGCLIAPAADRRLAV